MPPFFIRYWYEKKTAAARLSDFRDLQCDPAPVEGAAPAAGLHDETGPALITFPSEVSISPHGKGYHTSPPYCSLTSSAPILKGICNYCHHRDRAAVAAEKEDSARAEQNCLHHCCQQFSKTKTSKFRRNKGTWIDAIAYVCFQTL